MHFDRISNRVAPCRTGSLHVTCSEDSQLLVAISLGKLHEAGHFGGKQRLPAMGRAPSEFQWGDDGLFNGVMCNGKWSRKPWLLASNIGGHC